MYLIVKEVFTLFKKNIKFSALICLFLLLLYSDVHAAAIKNPVSSDPFKAWTIKFNQNIDLTSLTQNPITVLNDEENIVPITLSLGKDGKSIIVNPPAAGYGMDESYKLTINSNLHSQESKHLNKVETFSFTIKKYLTDNEIKDVLKNVEDNTIKMCYSRNNDKILKADGRAYIAFTDEFNSEEKVYKFLRNYYTDEMCVKMMKYFGTRFVEDSYAELCGDWGESTDWQSVTITNKGYIDSNTLEFTCDYYDKNNYSVNNKLTPKHHYSNYKLKYQDGRWLVAYNSNFK